MIKRHQDWPTLMHRHIKARRTEPFSWGKHDCCTWACDHIAAITGEDLYTEFRGTYMDKRSAFASIRAITKGKTVEDVVGYVTTKHNIPELTHPHYAQRGDIVVFDQTTAKGKTEPIIGVVNLCGQVALFVGAQGMQKIPVSQCRRAWRIGAVHPNGKEVKNG